MSDWNPALYSRFEDERTRPARDLLARVPMERASTVIDLGCGPGNSTELLAARFPEAQLTGVDASPAMVEAARQRLPSHRFEVGDVTTWGPSRPAEVIFANAVLQWVPDHGTLLPRLFGLLAPGGVLAIQMPDNLDEHSHRAMRIVAGEPSWREALRDAAAARTRLPALSAYYDLFAAIGGHVDVWRTAYQHPMATPAAIVEWLSATGLRPFLDALPSDRRRSFLARYEAVLDREYPARADGKRLLAFPRVFIVAQRLVPA